MRRMLQVDWRTWLAFSAALLVIFAVVDKERESDAREALASENKQIRADTAKREAKLLSGQRVMQERIDRLIEQNAELVRLFDEAGIQVPPGLVAQDRVTRVESDDDDSDDDGDTIIVRPQSQPSTSRPTSNPPHADDDDVLDLPTVPLPDEAGEATDTAKRIVDDVTGIRLD